MVSIDEGLKMMVSFRVCFSFPRTEHGTYFSIKHCAGQVKISWIHIVDNA